jgi:2-dehydropantoate 2-reductase
MHIVVFGAGGVGAYFGGRLVQGGERVTFIARGDHLHAMLKDGLKVDSTKGNIIIQPVTATEDTTQVEDVDAIFCCVKTWQIPEAAQAILPMLGPETFVVPLENGVETPAQLAETLGSNRVLPGLCSLFSRIVAPGHIQHAGAEPFIAFGEPDNHPSERAENLLTILENSGIEAEIPSDITVALWQKFLYTTALSAIGSITRVPVGNYRALQQVRQMCESIMQECYDIAVAQGINLPADSVANTLASLDILPPAATPSMQRDIMHGCPSELESQIGIILRLGQKLNIPTPISAFIYYCLLPQENLARKVQEQAS